MSGVADLLNSKRLTVGKDLQKSQYIGTLAVPTCRFPSVLQTT